MEKDHSLGLAILLGIIAIAAFGGFKNSALNQSGSTATQKQTLQQQIADDQKQVNDLQAQLRQKIIRRITVRFRFNI